MVSEKIIVILLIIAILLSVVSIVFTIGMNFDLLKIKAQEPSSTAGNVGLIVEGTGGASSGGTNEKN